MGNSQNTDVDPEPIIVEGGTPDEAIQKFLLLMRSETNANLILQVLRSEIVTIVGEGRLKNLRLHIYIKNSPRYLKLTIGNAENFVIINLVKGEVPRIKWGQHEQQMKSFPPTYADAIISSILDMKV